MNYRHAYHAGNFADVFKHVALTLALAHLGRKDTPFAVFDLHAGIGRYDLAGVEAGKTGEWLTGIGQLLDGPSLPGTEPYLEVVRAMNPGGALRFYPGSPRIARALLRPGDRMVLNELHPDDLIALKAEFRRDRQVTTHGMDAYAALKAMVPPPERRGLVLIDPPFEEKDEFDRVLDGLAQGLRRWASGTYAIWYPIKDLPPVVDFHQRLAALAGERPVLAADFLIHPPYVPFRLNGCGLAFINPPWKLDEALAELMPRLNARLGNEDGESHVRLLGDPTSKWY
ncbi:MAG: 23S rRNA (adenine(2030)-N(6))-methyltransferase RlmJ [Alphaproteobacteria bacterium]|nr:23S rRNA (adenine(2030)-N(6))-methyltransferase RlmJ [Alphaproteobacteria bacterium]